MSQKQIVARAECKINQLSEWQQTVASDFSQDISSICNTVKFQEAMVCLLCRAFGVFLFSYMSILPNRKHFLSYINTNVYM